mgnify:FL=1
MLSNFNRFANFPRNQEDIYAQRSDSADLRREYIVQVQSAGTIKYEALNGVAYTRTVVDGEVLICLVKKIWSTGTTVTAIIGYY